MDLRDQFAMHIAAALVGALRDPDDIARRSYTLAEAMLIERARRINADEREAIRHGMSAPPASGDELAGHADRDPGPSLFEHHAALLDEPAPMEEEAELEPPYDPAWDLEPVVRLDASNPPASEVERSRPGLARTQPDAASEEQTDEQRERSA